MTKTRNTKSALLTSILALFLCFTMLLGTTFAWFTDSVTSANNIIKAGNLDIELYHSDKAVTDEKVGESTKLFDEVALWEPGVMVWEKLTVKNEGDLALKYQLTLNVLEATKIDGVSFASMLKVALVDDEFEYTRENVEAIAADEWQDLATFTLAGKLDKTENDVYGIVIWWQPSDNDNLFNMNNGNKGKEVSVQVGVTLLATQLEAENDAFGNDYDKDATYSDASDVWDGTVDTAWYNDTDTIFTLSTAEEFAGFAELVNEGNKFSGKTVELESNIDFNGEEWTPIKNFAGTLKGNGNAVSNFEIDATAGNAGFFDVLEWATIENLTLSDITATVGNYRFGVLSRSINQTNVDNVTVKNVNVTTVGSEAFVAGLFCQGTVNSNMEVNNCTVENFTVNAENGAMIIGGITCFVQKNGTEAEGTNIFENLNVKNFKVIANDTDGYCNIGGLVGQTQSVWQNPRFNNCSVSGLDVTAMGTVNVGGFMCAPGSYTYAEDCTVEGKIDVSGVTSANNYAGGFFGDYGWGDNVGKGDHKVTNCVADVDITTKYASAGGFVGSGTNSEGRNKNITLTNCEAKGTVSLVDGGTANVGGFAGQTDRGIYINCFAAQDPFIGKVLDGYTLVDDGNGTLTVTK